MTDDRKVLIVGDGGMDKRLLIAAMAGLAAAPVSMPMIDVHRRDIPAVPSFGWRPPKWRIKSKKHRRDPSRLQLRGWPEIPCDPPHGYFWHRAPLGKQLYYLLRIP